MGGLGVDVGKYAREPAMCGRISARVQEVEDRTNAIGQAQSRPDDPPLSHVRDNIFRVLVIS